MSKSSNKFLDNEELANKAITMSSQDSEDMPPNKASFAHHVVVCALLALPSATFPALSSFAVSASAEVVGLAGLRKILSKRRSAPAPMRRGVTAEGTPSRDNFVEGSFS
jgi:hypothetical protein